MKAAIPRLIRNSQQSKPKANLDLLFLTSFPPEAPLIMKQARDMGIQSIFIGGRESHGKTQGRSEKPEHVDFLIKKLDIHSHCVYNFMSIE